MARGDRDGTFGFALAALLPIPGVGEFVAAAAGAVVVTYVVVKGVEAGIAYSKGGRQNVRTTQGGTTADEKANNDRRNSGGDGRGTQQKKPSQDLPKKAKKKYD